MRWNAEIAEMRKKWLRRRAHRTKKCKAAEAVKRAAEYLQAKKGLNKAIKQNKYCTWQDLRKEVKVKVKVRNPWGLDYRIVTRKLRNLMPGGVKDAEIMDNIVNTLFPAHPIRNEETGENGKEEIPLFSETKLTQAVKTLKTGRLPGQTESCPRHWKVVAQTNPEMLLNMYNSYLKEGCFPRRWKRQRLLLIYKEKEIKNCPPPIDIYAC